MMMVICFCGMVDRRKVFSSIHSRDHCQRFLPSQILDTLRQIPGTLRAGFEHAQIQSLGFVKK